MFVMFAPPEHFSPSALFTVVSLVVPPEICFIRMLAGALRKNIVGPCVVAEHRRWPQGDGLTQNNVGVFKVHVFGFWVPI